MASRKDTAVAFALGAALGIGGTLAAQRVADVALPEGGDALSHVEIIDRARPIDPEPAKLLERLDTNTGAEWSAELFQDLHPVHGGVPLRGNAKALRRLEAVLKLPDLRENGLLGVSTNAMNPASVKQNGALAVLWFRGSPQAQDWLVANQDVFTDPALTGDVSTWWAGTLAVHYLPSGVADRTSAFEQWMKEAVTCPTHGFACTLTPDQL